MNFNDNANVYATLDFQVVKQLLTFSRITINKKPKKPSKLLHLLKTRQQVQDGGLC